MTAASPTPDADGPFRRPVPVQITLTGAEAIAAQRWQSVWGWNTNFNNKTVNLTEIDTLLRRDGIKPVDDPLFATASEAPDYMRDREPVIAINVDGDARAYPLAMLMWHEIVNDVVGGEPLTITFCPLCNSALTFKRTLEGHVLTFGTSGNLRNSDLVMWDRQTESWWQQITGEAIVGNLAGKVLDQVPSPIVAWESFKKQYPDGKVLLRELNSFGGFFTTYDDPPYAGYDSVDTNPFLFTGPRDGRLPAASRVLTLKRGDDVVAYPWEFLKEARVINDTVGGDDIVAFFDDGTLSAFQDDDYQDIQTGSSTVYDRNIDGQLLTFTVTGKGITDLETGSVWNVLGAAVSGPLEGANLTPLIHANHFWFAWVVFQPDTEIRDSEDSVSGPVSPEA